MPVDGEVLEFNESLNDNPELVNSDPYGAGWIIKVKVSQLDQLNDLMDSEAYHSFLG
jgi:glycine cleavage system H protein